MIGIHPQGAPCLGAHRAQMEAVRRADRIDGTGGLRHLDTDPALIRRIDRQFPPADLFLPDVGLVGADAPGTRAGTCP